MLRKNPKKSLQNFHCETCDYTTRSKKDYQKHILTRKHKHAKSMLNFSMTEWSCECGKYFKHQSSLSRHKISCSEFVPFLGQTENDIISTNNDYIDNANMAKQMMAFHEETMKAQQKNNMDMMNMFLHQQMSHFKEMLPLVGSTTNNVHTNCNNTFNMNVFLNETCKDAMNLEDFVKSLQFNMEDLLYTAENGYVEGIGKILLRGLDELALEQRPIHCSDVKREVMYIKKDGVWGKDTIDNEELCETILLIGRMNLRNLPPWMKAHPSYSQATSPFSDIYAQIILNNMVESVEMGQKYTTRIIKNVAKRVHIDRNVLNRKV